MLANRVRMGSRKKYTDEVYLAQDSDFVKVSGRWVYRGSELKIEIPHTIQGEEITSYAYMFYGTGDYSATPVTRVVSTNKNITDMSAMFQNSQATSLDLSSFDTSNVTNMIYMFYNSRATSLDLSSFDTSKVTNMTYMFCLSQATSLDLSNFDTSKVTNMNNMFQGSQATSLDLSSFDTSNVTHMGGMFANSQATILDLSSFDTSKVTNMDYMFYGASATIGYARTQYDANRFNNSSGKPSGLVFVVK